MSALEKNILELINEIELEDLQYVESDLRFHELVSLGFLLYGDDRFQARFIVQRLVILLQHPRESKDLQVQTTELVTSDILRNYTRSNPQAWRLHIVEALAIIGARRILRKLGLPWLEIYHYFLPHVPELSVHIHPLLKALYIIAERLTPDKAGKLIYEININSQSCGNFRFYDFSYLEIFLLNWFIEHIIEIGDKQLTNCNVEILIEYFKISDMVEIKNMLLETINQNRQNDVNDIIKKPNSVDFGHTNLKKYGIATSGEMKHSYCGKYPSVERLNCVDNSDRYIISRKNAGYVLIINQKKFYKETDPKLKHLVPRMHESVPKRKGTNVDRDKLKELFTSFGYKALIFENLSHLEILHRIRKTVKQSFLKDSLIICILSHGMEGVVFGCNTIPVAITEIKEILTADTVKGKPKMLIIQACQRNVPTLEKKTSTSSRSESSPDAYADILLAMSSIPGTDALRHTEHGSWFVDSLYEITKKYGDRKHMLDILTAVTCDISKRKGDENQVMLPSTSSTMRKNFYLPSEG